MMAATLKNAIASALACVCVSAVGTRIAGQAGSQRDAESVFKNGRIYTMDAKKSWAQAVAVKNGTIVYTGTDAGVGPFTGANTKVIDLNGRMMLPGFIDTHNHAYARTEALFWVTLKTASLDAYKEATQAFLGRHPDAKQVRGVGWNMNFVTRAAAETKRHPRELLDDIVGRDIPGVFITNGHHEIWANTPAMRNAHITKDTPNPPGAFIERDQATGEPTGIFGEFGAQNLIIRALPEPDFTIEQFE
jgi:predicted amidohydrolase YtcJ